MVLANQGWISTSDSKDLKQIEEGDAAKGSILRAIAIHQQRVVAEKWRLFTLWFRWCGTIAIGFLVGWQAFYVFTLLTQIMDKAL
jgi:hypothetical protein